MFLPTADQLTIVPYTGVLYSQLKVVFFCLESIDIEPNGYLRRIFMKYDVIIVGAGPAGIFTAMEMVKKGTSKNILMIEKGSPIEKRSCPMTETNKCVNCKPCNITTGFSGAGAFSDGKLS